MLSTPPYDRLKPGTRLRYSLWDDKGRLLLAQGVEITERLVALLERRGITLTLQAALKVRGGERDGMEIPLTRPQLVLGRLPSCDVPLDGLTVSGLHCRILKMQAGVFLEDLRSRNGTFVNGRVVSLLTELSAGDVIRVGEATFALQLYAALATDTEEGSRALEAWKQSEAAARRPASPYIPTEAEIDLDSLME